MSKLKVQKLPLALLQSSGITTSTLQDWSWQAAWSTLETQHEDVATWRSQRRPLPGAVQHKYSTHLFEKCLETQNVNPKSQIDLFPCWFQTSGCLPPLVPGTIWMLPTIDIYSFPPSSEFITDGEVTRALEELYWIEICRGWNSHEARNGNSYPEKNMKLNQCWGILSLPFHLPIVNQGSPSRDGYLLER